MGVIGLIVLGVLVSFGAVMAIGWDGYIDVLDGLKNEFGEFVKGGIVEVQERI